MAPALNRKTLIVRMKATAKRLGRTRVTQPEFCRLGDVTRHQISKHFDSYSELLQAAGLRSHVYVRRLSDYDLMRGMAEAFRKAKGIVTYIRFGKHCRYSNAAYDRRWGSWSAALMAFRDWQAQNDPKFPYAAELASLRMRGRALGDRGPVWHTLGGRRFGDTLNFRGLLHAPVNEMGVVFLFATLAAELGFLVESLTPEFPDCEAKRRVGKAWERVRIEFEYESRSFKEHRHDPKACDLVVCWEHNWPQCPIEVVELKTVVAKWSPCPQLAKTAAIGASPAPFDFPGPVAR